MKLYLRWIILTAVVLPLFSVQSYGKGFSFAPETPRNYKFVKKVPENATQHIVIVSTRNFTNDLSGFKSRGVQPQHKLHWFLASLVGDTSYITTYSDLEEAMKMLPRDKDLLFYVNGHGKNFDLVLNAECGSGNVTT